MTSNHPTRAEHTPTLSLPLRVSVTTSHFVDIIDDENRLVARVQNEFGGALTADDCTRADQLIRCVNTHDQLLAIARDYAAECATCDGARVLTGEVGFHEDCPDCFDIWQVIEVATGKVTL